jgi:hypothetical protein
MAQVTITVNDVLPEKIEQAISEVRDLLVSHIQREQPSTVSRLLAKVDRHGDIAAIIESAVPFRTADINAAWFLHGKEIEDAYYTAGCGRNPRENGGRTAIHVLIEQRVHEWFARNADSVFEEVASS